MSKGPPVCSGAPSCLCACMSLISLRGEGGDKKQKNKGCGVSWGIEGRRREVGEGGRELKEGGGWGWMGWGVAVR